jgi:DNA topoisomerase-1
LGKALIIVESPAKATTIKKYLGADYEVEASAGHVKDLPERSLGVDVDNDFAVRFEVVKGKRKILDRLKKIAATVDRVFLAPDPDREGEAIAWHIAEEIRDVAPNIERVLFSEITKDAVRKAIAFPRELDSRMYDSQLARRILDRLVGYQISPILWRKVQGGLSAGRVQSVAVRLVVEREREIEAFETREYWVLAAIVQREGVDSKPFRVVLRRVGGKKAEVGSRDVADALLARLRVARFTIASVERKDRKRAPLPPFITSSLQQEASRLLRFSPSHTMSVAQRLYEGMDLGEEGRVGLITYMRTDSVRLSADAITGLRDAIVERFGQDYLPAKPLFYKNRKSAQDAHEAIRPSLAEWTPSRVKPFLGRDEFRLYNLIYNRTLACQMVPAVYDQTTVDVEAVDAEFRATGSVLRFDGHLAAWKNDTEVAREIETETPEPDAEESTDHASLPAGLSTGDALSLVDLKGDQKFTEPPPRYSEATLVRELEERGIGRPSTYASIVGTIQTKSYAQKHEGKLRPTELGRIVNDLLVRHFKDIVDFDFTARMEQNLDEVEEGKKGRLELLNEFYASFDGSVKLAVSEMRSVKADAIPSGLDCELCGKPMLIRLGKNGTFLGCSGYPECRNTCEFERNDKGQVLAKATEDVGKCPKCDSLLQVRAGRFGKFVACTSYPQCDFTRPHTRPEKCPAEGCDGQLVEKVSRKGKKFLSCSRYPACRFLTGLTPVAETCPQCTAPTLFVRSFRGSRTVTCQREGCGYTRREAGRVAERRA